MNKKKILTTLFIISSILTMSLVFQPKFVHAAEVKLLFFNEQIPQGDVYQGDPVIFGATIFNNSTDTFRFNSFRVDVYRINTSDLEEHSTLDFTFPENDVRYVIAPSESKTLYFETNMSLPLAVNYTLQLWGLYRDIESESPGLNDFQIGENVTLNVLYRRDTAPSYIWVVFALLIVGILAFVVAAIVSWARERKNK